MTTTMWISGRVDEEERGPEPNRAKRQRFPSSALVCFDLKRHKRL